MLDAGNDPNPYWTALWGIVGTALVFASVVGLQAMFYHVEEAETYRKVVAPASTELSSLRAMQLADLHRYRWISEAEGVVGLPIERAMELIAEELDTDGGGS